MSELVFEGATVIDGTGSDPFSASVTIEADRISQVGDSVKELWAT